MSVVSKKKLLEAGVHIGHNTRRWNPKMKPYIYTARNGIYILDLDQTQQQIENAYNALKDIVANNGKILFVGTKKQAQQIVMEEALRCGSFYVNQRWLGGLLTNYRTIQKRVKRLIEIEEMEESGKIELYPKKEQAQLRKEKSRLENFLGGIKEMKKLPNAVVVLDTNEEAIAVAEANKLGIPVFGLVDTNCNPESVTYPIASNNDALRAIKLLSGLLADAICEAKNEVVVYANQVEETDVTMDDVLVNVDQMHAENERRRQERLELQRKRQQARRESYARNKNGGRRPYQNRNNEEKTEEVKKEEPKKEEVKKEAASENVAAGE